METIENITVITKALSDANRLKILALLQNKPLCVCEIEHLLTLAQPTISSHLKVLVNAKLIKAEKQGTWVIYHLIADELPPTIKQIVTSALTYLSNASEIKELLKRQSTLDVKSICN